MMYGIQVSIWASLCARWKALSRPSTTCQLPMRQVRDAWRHRNLKSINTAVGVKEIQHAAYDVGMVLLHNGCTASRHVQRYSSTLLLALLNQGVSSSFQEPTITSDNKVSGGMLGRV